jgi:hypothetical protein
MIFKKIEDENNDTKLGDSILGGVDNQPGILNIKGGKKQKDGDKNGCKC